MARAANAFTDEPSGTIERGRGGFYRNSVDTPYVSVPTGELVKSGPRKGQAKRTPYGSPSGFGKLIENSKALEKWGERRVVLGIGTNLALIADCARLAALDVDSDEYKTEADRIIVAAKEAAETSLAADRGSHGHAITEDDDEGRSWIERAEAGELLGMAVEVQHAIVQAWRDMLEREGLVILVSEASCVDDTWRLAGTLDNLALCTKELRFRLATGEIRTIPAGTVLVLDKKTGQRRLDRDGSPLYWHGYVIQVASYAQSVPYDTETETRGEWAWPISQDHALIAHLDVLGAINGTPSCTLVYVDLAAGRDHGGGTVLAAKAWNSRNDLLSVGQVDDAEIAAPAPSDALPSGDVETVQQSTTAATPPAVAVVLDPVDQLAQVATDPDEGAEVRIEDMRALKEHHDALDDACKSWLRELRTVALQHGVSFMLNEVRTVRRYEITRGLVLMCRARADDDDTLRALLYHLLGDVALYPAVKPGHALGSLNVDQAAEFALLADALHDGRFTATVDDDGQVSLHLAA